MTLSELEVWLAQRRYAEVRLAETAARAFLPDGRRLRGLKISEWFYLGRDMQFYCTVLGMAEPMTLLDVCARTSLVVLEHRWQRARTRAGLAKARRAERAFVRRS